MLIKSINLNLVAQFSAIIENYCTIFSAFLMSNLCMRWFREFTHYKLIILFFLGPEERVLARICTQYGIKIANTTYILPSFTDFSLSRINVNANLYFLNGRGDYNRCSTTHTILLTVIHDTHTHKHKLNKQPKLADAFSISNVCTLWIMNITTIYLGNEKNG